MKADYKKYIYDYQHWIIYDNLAEKAKCFDIESNTKDLIKAYSMYEKCAIAHIAIAERRLGSMTINGDGTDADFNKGLGYYLMAAEDVLKRGITGVDIVRDQLRVSGGAQLGYTQEDIQFSGHAIECRINAENPKTFYLKRYRVLRILIY